MAPIASATRICEASSNTTMSNRPAVAGKNRATESGLTSTQGSARVIRSPYVLMQLAHLHAAALGRQLPLQLADLAAGRARVEPPRREDLLRDDGGEVVRGLRGTRSTNRVIERSWAAASKLVEPGRAGAVPRSRREPARARTTGARHPGRACRRALPPVPRRGARRAAARGGRAGRASAAANRAAGQRARAPPR